MFRVPLLSVTVPPVLFSEVVTLSVPPIASAPAPLTVPADNVPVTDDVAPVLTVSVPTLLPDALQLITLDALAVRTPETESVPAATFKLPVELVTVGAVSVPDAPKLNVPELVNVDVPLIVTDDAVIVPALLNVLDAPMVIAGKDIPVLALLKLPDNEMGPEDDSPAPACISMLPAMIGAADVRRTFPASAVGVSAEDNLILPP